MFVARGQIADGAESSTAAHTTIGVPMIGAPVNLELAAVLLQAAWKHSGACIRDDLHGVTCLNSTTQTHGLLFHESAPLMDTHSSRQASNGSHQLPGPGSSLRGWK